MTLDIVMRIVWDLLAIIGAFTVMITGMAVTYHTLNHRHRHKHRWPR